jgi:cyclopropane-fatty-acyl-phospholipid synthase
MRNPKDLLKFASDFVMRGPVYAIAADRMNSPTPLEPAENWDFWAGGAWDSLIPYLTSYPPQAARKAYLDSILKIDHATGIESHYDVSNEFYALFLDRKYKFYSCAEFTSSEDTLEEAQEKKAEHIYSLLNLRGDEKILELGCGWGSMLKFLNDKGHTGDLQGLTLSNDQLNYAKESLGLNVSLTNFVTEPFDGQPYDRIFSIGAFEHIKPNEIEYLYAKMFDALAPGGRAILHFFTLNRDPYPVAMIISQLFFPGSMLVLHHRHTDAAKNAGFLISHDSRHDYRPTLRAWYDRLSERREEALKLVGLKVYNQYMSFFPLSWLFFNQNDATVHRMILEKPAR